MLNIVIPMAGAGSRFVDAGYTVPKPFIDVLGKPMIYHVLENLRVPQSTFILLVRREHLESHAPIVRDIEAKFSVKIVVVEKLTEGAACTVLYAHRLINNETPLLIANSDQIVDIDINSYLADAAKRKLDGSVLTFEDDNAKWSYAKINEAGFITEIREKKVISNNATVGIYYFTRGDDFVGNALDMIVRNVRVNNEFYVAPVYNYGIAQDKKYGIFTVTKSAMHGTGTPEDLNAYISIKKQEVAL
jgi:dTDP-glucose pyrophosphorylase